MINYYIVMLKPDKTEEEFNTFWKNKWERDFGVKNAMIQQNGIYLARVNSKPKTYDKYKQFCIMNIYDGNDECLILNSRDMHDWFKVISYVNYCKNNYEFINIRKKYYENKYTNDGYNKIEMERYAKNIFSTPLSEIYNLSENENLIYFIKSYCRVNKIDLDEDEIKPIAKSLSELIINFALTNDISQCSEGFCFHDFFNNKVGKVHD